jgi:hypothetical protein
VFWKHIVGQQNQKTHLPFPALPEWICWTWLPFPIPVYPEDSKKQSKASACAGSGREGKEEEDAGRGQLWTLLYHFKSELLSSQACLRTVWVRVWVWLCVAFHMVWAGRWVRIAVDLWEVYLLWRYMCFINSVQYVCQNKMSLTPPWIT